MTYLEEVPMSFDDYDEETLAITCPDCNAAVTGKCLTPKPGGMGGLMYLPSPHRNRVLAGHGKVPAYIWGE
jgi:hypothetical protein